MEKPMDLYLLQIMDLPSLAIQKILMMLPNMDRVSLVKVFPELSADEDTVRKLLLDYTSRPLIIDQNIY
jgi:hypothetical protein